MRLQLPREDACACACLSVCVFVCDDRQMISVITHGGRTEARFRSPPLWNRWWLWETRGSAGWRCSARRVVYDDVATDFMQMGHLARVAPSGARCGLLPRAVTAAAVACLLVARAHCNACRYGGHPASFFSVQTGFVAWSVNVACAVLLCAPQNLRPFVMFFFFLLGEKAVFIRIFFDGGCTRGAAGVFKNRGANKNLALSRRARVVGGRGGGHGGADEARKWRILNSSRVGIL